MKTCTSPFQSIQQFLVKYLGIRMDFSIMPDDVFQSLNMFISFEQTPDSITINIVMDCISYQIELSSSLLSRQFRQSIQNKRFKLLSKSHKILKIEVNEQTLELESFNNFILKKINDLQYEVNYQININAQLENQLSALKGNFRETINKFDRQIESIYKYFSGLQKNFEQTEISLTKKNASLKKDIDACGQAFKFNDDQLAKRLDRLKEDLQSTKKYLKSMDLDIEKHLNRIRKDFESDKQVVKDNYYNLKEKVNSHQDSLKNLTEKSNHKTKLFTDLQHIVKEHTKRLELQQKLNNLFRLKINDMIKQLVSKQPEVDYLQELTKKINTSDPKSNPKSLNAKYKNWVLDTKMSDMQKIYSLEMLETKKPLKKALKKSQSYRDTEVKKTSKEKNKINRTPDFDNQENNIKVKSIYQLQKQTRSKPKLSPYTKKYHPIDSITKLYTNMKDSLRNKSVHSAKKSANHSNS